MTHAETWAHGYAAGSESGLRDHHAERDGTYRRDPHHQGQQPPAHHTATWVDGFLTGYADLRGGQL